MAEQTNIVEEQPQPVMPLEPPADTQESSSDAFVDDIIKSAGTEDGVRPFAVPAEEGEVPSDSPRIQAQEGEAIPQTEPPAGNDEVRYQYWQSEADKTKNELDNLKRTNEILTGQLSSFMSTGQQVQPAVTQEEEMSEEFPPPPDKPKRPHSYNRDEAYSDPSSDSAHYADSIEEWRDDMDEYNRLHAEYQTALVQSEREQMESARKKDDILKNEVREQDERMTQMRTYIKGKYGADDTVFQDFVQVMSDPKSVNPDNLWRLYSLDRGLQQGTPQPVTAGPSPTFSQTKRAQSVPSPMGVLPSQNIGVTGSSVEDRIMDELVRDQEKVNPW